MITLITNAEIIHSCIKKNVKTSFIDLRLMTKWYNKKDNYSIEVTIGSARHPLQNSAFYKQEVDDLLTDLNSKLGSFELDSYEFKEVKDNRSGKMFQLMIMKFTEVEIP